MRDVTAVSLGQFVRRKILYGQGHVLDPEVGFVELISVEPGSSPPKPAARIRYLDGESITVSPGLLVVTRDVPAELRARREETMFVDTRADVFPACVEVGVLGLRLDVDRLREEYPELVRPRVGERCVLVDLVGEADLLPMGAIGDVRGEVIGGISPTASARQYTVMFTSAYTNNTVVSRTLPARSIVPQQLVRFLVRFLLDR